MPKLIAVTAVTVMREGERVTVTPGQLFDFTAEELKDIEKASSPEVQIVRKPINESSAAAGDDDEGDGDTTTKAPATKSATKPASKTTKGKDNDL